MRNLLSFRLVLLLVALVLAGCASNPRSGGGTLPAEFERTTEEQVCVDWFAKLDAVVGEAGVADAEAMRLAGFPHLRINRFLASFRDELDSSAKRAAWLAHLQQLGMARRRIEISNLPTNSLVAISSDRGAALDRASACAKLLAGADRASPSRMAALRERATVPDSYSRWKRAAGGYAFTRIPFLSGVRDWQQRLLVAFERTRVAGNIPQTDGRWQSFALGFGAADSLAEPAASTHVARDPLGIPMIGSGEIDALARLHAPIFNVETVGAYDKFGRLNVPLHPAKEPGTSPGVVVDTGTPLAYVRHDFTRYGQTTLLQLTYTVWFPERPADSAFDLLAGKLDGLMIRLTFGPSGEIVLVDSAHACGCYHLFFPIANAAVRPPPTAIEEEAFVPVRLPRIAAGQRLRVWVASRTHYLVGLDAAASVTATNTFSLASTSEAEIGTHEVPARGEIATRSLFGPDGMVPGSERGERFFFWPMGIASAGQMRQWGHHATAFVGRRHFDDPFLVERYFDIPGLSAR